MLVNGTKHVCRMGTAKFCEQDWLRSSRTDHLLFQCAVHRDSSNGEVLFNIDDTRRRLVQSLQRKSRIADVVHFYVSLSAALQLFYERRHGYNTYPLPSTSKLSNERLASSSSKSPVDMATSIQRSRGILPSITSFSHSLYSDSYCFELTTRYSVSKDGIGPQGELEKRLQR